MRPLLLTDWTTISGSATGVTSITQDPSEWLDLAGDGDVVFCLQAAETTTPGGFVYINLETSPTLDESFFVPLMPPVLLPLAVTPTILRATQTPVARYVRWRLSTTATTSGAWDATFRIWASAGVTPLSFPIVAVDFTGLALGDMTSAALAAAIGLSFARASDGYTVQTAAATIAAALTGNDRPRIGSIGASWGRGLVVEEARTNNLKHSRDISNADWAGAGVGTQTITGSFANGPDGTSGATRVQITAAANVYSKYQSVTADSVNRSTYSYWIKGNGGHASPNQAWLMQDASSTANAVAVPFTSAWSRFVEASQAPDTHARDFIVSDWETGDPLSPLTAPDVDMLADFCQIETGSFATEAIATTTTTLTRSAERLYDATGSRWVDAGRISLEIKMIPKGGSSAYAADMQLWRDHSGTATAWIDHSTQKLNVYDGTTSQTLSTAMTWASGDVVEIFVAAGGGSLSTTAAYRVNGGATVQLGTAAALATLAPAGALDLLCNASAGFEFSAWVLTLNAYKSGQAPLWSTAQ